jgi:hypothetical protein
MRKALFPASWRSNLNARSCSVTAFPARTQSTTTSCHFQLTRMDRTGQLCRCEALVDRSRSPHFYSRVYGKSSSIHSISRYATFVRNAENAEFGIIYQRCINYKSYIRLNWITGWSITVYWKGWERKRWRNIWNIAAMLTRPSISKIRYFLHLLRIKLNCC